MEHWKVIEATNGLQEVSNLGRIRYKGEIQKLKKQSNGYLIAQINLIFGSRHFLVHRLVAVYFIKNENPEINTQVNHIDGNKNNNSSENLEWCTPKYNIRHRKIVLKKDMIGENNPMYGKSGSISPAFKGFILQINPEDNKIVGRYAGSGEASAAIKGYASNLLRVLGKDRTYHGYKWIRETSGFKTS